MTQETVRARDLGLIAEGTPGAHNAITDVPGVQVGFTTLREDLDGANGPVRVRTGVTAILPRGHSGAGLPAAAGMHSLNGNGEMTGTVWIREAGSLSTPVLITNTHSVGAVHEGAICWMLDNSGRTEGEDARWSLPVVAETWDDRLNDINGLHVRPEHAVAALDSAAAGPVAEGAVGGGTGMVCYGFKGGSGTASRKVRLGKPANPVGATPEAREESPERPEYTVGVFLQANFGAMGELTVRGVPVGPTLKAELVDQGAAEHGIPEGAGSVIVVVATDAPLLPGQCTALARRAALGLARTGTASSHFSGDIFLAFSTANEGALVSAPPSAGADVLLDHLEFVPWGHMDPLYTAVVQATEEAVLNALAAGRTMEGHAATIPGLPLERVGELIADRAVS